MRIQPASTLLRHGLIENATAALMPYTKNRNTGNYGEIFVILSVYRAMGLSDAELGRLMPVLLAIRAHNPRDATKLDATLDAVRRRGVGRGLSIHGGRVVGVRNVTQDDQDGATGDIILCLQDEREVSLSIFVSKVASDGSIQKCLSNPTCRRYGCTDEDVAVIKQTAGSAVLRYKEEMTRKYGAEESGWPSRVVSLAAKEACATVAAQTAARFNSLSADERLRRFRDLIRTTTTAGKPADMLCVVSKDCRGFRLFNIDRSNVEDGDVRLRAEGHYLLTTVDGVDVGKTQVKFNNGVYHKGCASSLHSSWNACCYMHKVFAMTPVTLEP
jgi:hypothetical protein